jgi:hypothetical protein
MLEAQRRISKALMALTKVKRVKVAQVDAGAIFNSISPQRLVRVTQKSR